MIKFRLKAEGVAPLLMHNGRLANPLDPATKALKKATAKRTKTDDDFEEIAHTEYLGSLYFDTDISPYIPGQNIQRTILDAARFQKLGKQIERGLFIDSDINPVGYKGPRDPEQLWADANFRFLATVRNGQNRVSRCRPIFREWRVEAEGTLDPEQLNFDQLAQIVEQSGMYVGLGDWRPRYGRFRASVEVL